MKLFKRHRFIEKGDRVTLNEEGLKHAHLTEAFNGRKCALVKSVRDVDLDYVKRFVNVILWGKEYSFYETVLKKA